MYTTNIINLAPIATPAAFAELINLADDPCIFVKFTRAGSGLEFIRSSNGQLLIIRRSVVLSEKQKRLDELNIKLNLNEKDKEILGNEIDDEKSQDSKNDRER